MAEAIKPRRVSGEIRTGTASGREARPDVLDVVDVEFETVSMPESAQGGERGPQRPAGGAVSLEGLSSLRATASPPVRSRRGGPVFWGIGSMLVAGAFWISGGHSVLHRAGAGPQPNQFGALRIADVRSRIDHSGSRPMLFVDGAAANDGAATTLPPIEIRVTGPSGRVTRYKLGTAERLLASGGHFAFSSRLEVPKDGVESVLVTFSGKESGDARGEGERH